MRFSFNDRAVRSLFGFCISCMFFSSAALVCYADVLVDPDNILVGVQTDSDAVFSESDVELGVDYEDNVEAFDESVLVPYLEDIDRLVADIHAEIVPGEVSDPGQYAALSLSDDEVSEFALTDDLGIDNNVVIYEGTWGSRSYRAVFPAAYEQYLIVTEDGYLYNVSGSSVTGRLFEGKVDYEEYEYSSLVLNSVLGNVASSIYNYGYPSYVRTYYVSDYDRIASTDTYGLFKVDNIVRTDSSDPVRIGNNYMLVLMMIGGMMFLCLLKKSQV